VGSSKSTIARLLKKGLERYSNCDQGALYTIGWVDLENPQMVPGCPRHEEPLHMIPQRFRADVTARLTAGLPDDAYHVKIQGELCPFCRYVYSDRLRHYQGDWTKVAGDVRVKRLLLSEKDRIGVGTF